MQGVYVLVNLGLASKVTTRTMKGERRPTPLRAWYTRGHPPHQRRRLAREVTPRRPIARLDGRHMIPRLRLDLVVLILRYMGIVVRAYVCLFWRDLRRLRGKWRAVDDGVGLRRLDR